MNILSFDNKYNIRLEVSQKDFIDKLLQLTKISSDISSDLFPDSKNMFIGTIDYNTFRLTKNVSSIIKNNYKIIGNIYEIDGKTQIDGEVKGYRFILYFVLTYTLICLTLSVNFLFFDHATIELKVGLLLFSFIGLLNYLVVIHGLNKFKKEFINKIRNV